MVGFESISQNLRGMEIGKERGQHMSVKAALLPPHPLERPLTLLLSGPGFSSSHNSSKYPF